MVFKLIFPVLYGPLTKSLQFFKLELIGVVCYSTLKYPHIKSEHYSIFYLYSFPFCVKQVQWIVLVPESFHTYSFHCNISILMECTVLIQLFYIYPGSFESICQSCQYEAELCPENVMYSDFYFFTPGYKHTYYHMCKNLTSLKSGLSEGLDLKSKMVAFKMHAPCGHHILNYLYRA